MKIKTPPQPADSPRPTKKVKRKAVSTTEQQRPRFAPVPLDKTPTSAQQLPTEISSSIVTVDQSPQDPTAMSTTLSTTDVVSDSHPPPSDPSSQTDFPPAILPPNLLHLTKKYSFATMSLNSGSKIQQKVRTLINHLSRFDFLDRDMKPGVVALHAKADVASKLVGVVEIAKRDIEALGRGGKWYQYSRVSGELKEIPIRKSKKELKELAERKVAAEKGGRTLNNTKESEQLEGEEDDNEEEAFEPLPGSRAEQKPKDTKLRNIPVLTIYMARVPVPELKTEFRYVLIQSCVDFC